MRKNILFLAAAAAMLVGCTETEELAKNQQVESADGRIDFSVYANRTTRAGKAGALDSETLKAADAGFGVFAYYTQNTRYDKYSSTPNFMYNQFVKWDADYNGWNYYPAKYWPNEYGSNATSKDIDYLTFFAYAPYVVANPNTGIVEGSQQDKNITEVSRSAAKGDPFVRYIVDTNPQSSVDLLWGVAANEDFKGLANPDAVVKADNCFIDLSKQVGASDGKIQWKFYHALAKLNVQIIAAADVAAVNGNPYAEPGTAAIPASDSTKIYLRSIDFTGFVTQGMLSLHSDEPLAEANLMPKWMNYDGTKLTVSNVTFYDGLKDGKEGYANNINAGEKPQGLNPVLLEEPTRTKWSEKKPGVPTDKYVNLFAGAENAGDAIFVIPTNEPMDITIDYDIMTSDSHLGKNLSDGVTKGSRIPNTIRHSLNNLVIEAGKSYVIKLILGVESVKVTAVEVESWTDEDPQVVELPYNPGEGSGSESGETPSGDNLNPDLQDETVNNGWSRMSN